MDSGVVVLGFRTLSVARGFGGFAPYRSRGFWEFAPCQVWGIRTLSVAGGGGNGAESRREADPARGLEGGFDGPLGEFLNRELHRSVQFPI